ncbi:MAG: 6-phosphogluconolactonase [Chloroflexota bacterium]
MTQVRFFADPAALGMALAQEIVAGIDAARDEGRPYILGCPGGRSGRSTYQALATLLAGADLSHLIIAMMDDYVVQGSHGGWQHVPADVHYSCRRFAEVEIVAPLDALADVAVPANNIWLPEPADPEAYRDRLDELGGVDLFIVASGASDGHVAFVKPGTPIDSGVSIVPLAQSTRHDNMATFPEFTTLAEVPTHGVSVGLGTITNVSKSVRLVIHGVGKQTTAARVLAATDFDPAWPATFIHRCRNAQIWLDEAARPSGP